MPEGDPHKLLGKDIHRNDVFVPVVAPASNRGPVPNQSRVEDRDCSKHLERYAWDAD